MLCNNFRAATSHFFLMWNVIFDGIGEKFLPTKAALSASLTLSIMHRIGLRVNIWHRKNTACSKSNQEQSSRPKSSTWVGPVREKGVCSDSNRTAHQLQIALGKDVRDDSESMATKVCSQKFRKWNSMLESHVEIGIERTCFDFQIPKIYPRFQVLIATFLRSMSTSMCIEIKLWEEKLFQVQYM